MAWRKVKGTGMAVRRALCIAVLGGSLMGPTASVASESLWGAYLAARSASMANDFSAAAEHYGRTLAMSPGRHSLTEAAMSARLALGEVDAASAMASELLDAGSNSQVARMIDVAMLAHGDDWADLSQALEGQEVIGALGDGLVGAWALLGAGEADAAMAEFDRLSQKSGFTAFARYHHALALGSVGEYADLLNLLREGAGGMERSRRGAIAAAVALGQIGQHDDGAAYLDALFGVNADPVVADLKTRLSAGETVPFDMVETATDGIAEVYYSVASAMKDQTSDSYLLLYTRLAEALDPDHVDAKLLTATFLEDLGRYHLANQALARVPQASPAHLTAALQRADVLRAWNKPDAAIEVLEALSRSHPDTAEVLSDLGHVYRTQKRYDEARAAYDLALTSMKEADHHRWFVHYTRGIAHERLEDWPAAEEDFRASLALNPGQPQVLNYLGYSLVEKGQKLEEALDMIQEAVDARPENGYIRDSLGWAFYRLDRYEDAVRELEHAVELEATDAVINDHLGDALWAVGRKTEAEFQWHRALSLSPKEDDRPRIERKLAVGLDIVLTEEGEGLIRVANDDN